MTDCALHDPIPPMPPLGSIHISGVDSFINGGQADLIRGISNDPNMGGIVVVKCFRKLNRTTPEYDIAENEQVTCRLLGLHGNVVRFLGSVNTASLSPMLHHSYHPVSLVFEYHPSGNLIKFLNTADPKGDDTELRLRLLAQVAHGLSHIHGQSIVHGDLNGRNVLFDHVDEMAKICDFGSSLSECPCYESPSSRTGTVHWDSPELYEGDEPIRTSWSDIWAFGCLVLQIGIGREPWDTMSKPQIISRLMKGGLPAMEADVGVIGNPTLHAVWLLIQECWILNPIQRPPAQELSVQLGGFV